MDKSRRAAVTLAVVAVSSNGISINGRAGSKIPLLGQWGTTSYPLEESDGREQGRLPTHGTSRSSQVLRSAVEPPSRGVGSSVRRLCTLTGPPTWNQTLKMPLGSRCLLASGGGLLRWSRRRPHSLLTELDAQVRADGTNNRGLLHERRRRGEKCASWSNWFRAPRRGPNRLPTEVQALALCFSRNYCGLSTYGRRPASNKWCLLTTIPDKIGNGRRAIWVTLPMWPPARTHIFLRRNNERARSDN